MWFIAAESMMQSMKSFRVFLRLYAFLLFDWGLGLFFVVGVVGFVGLLWRGLLLGF